MFGIGQPVRRVEDRRFLTGRGQFVDDIYVPHQCFGVVLYSPHAHARIAKIDTAVARNSLGVLCVLTGADVAADRLGAMPPYSCQTSKIILAFAHRGHFWSMIVFGALATVWPSSSLKR